MTNLPYIFALAAVLAVALASIAIWSPRRLGTRAGAVALAALFLPAGYMGFSDLLSRPKPVSLEWWRGAGEQATVLSSQVREGVGVYLWLQLASMEEPRAYRLPWSKELVKQLDAAEREAREQGTALMMRQPFESTLDQREPKFYAMPQPVMPEKPYAGQGGGAQVYERPGQDA